MKQPDSYQMADAVITSLATASVDLSILAAAYGHHKEIENRALALTAKRLIEAAHDLLEEIEP